MEAPEKEVLRELGARLQTALAKLDSVVKGEKRYFEEAIERVEASLPLSEEEKRQLEEFGSRCCALLEQVRVQGRAHLEALARALERGQYVCERSKSTWHVRPEGEQLYAGVSKKASGGYIFRLPLRGINTTLRFPDLLKLPLPELEELQLGWRASDEGVSARTYPAMTTAKAWQVFAWLACRPGRAWVAVHQLNLTKQGLSIEWQALALDWRQKWKTKEEALRTLLESQKPKAWLTCFLGDGTLQGSLSGGGALLYANGKKSMYFPKDRIEKAVQAAGRYGILLEMIGCPKWEALKRHLPRCKPIRIMVEGVPMTLRFSRSNTGWSLRLCKYASTQEEAGVLARYLRARGYDPSINESTVAKYVRHYRIFLGAGDLAKLARRDAEVLKAVLELAERKGVNREEVLKRLGVAESPPLTQ